MELYVQKELKDKIEPILEDLKEQKEEAKLLSKKARETQD